MKKFLIFSGGFVFGVVTSAALLASVLYYLGCADEMRGLDDTAYYGDSMSGDYVDDMGPTHYSEEQSKG